MQLDREVPRDEQRAHPLITPAPLDEVARLGHELTADGEVDPVPLGALQRELERGVALEPELVARFEHGEGVGRVERPVDGRLVRAKVQRGCELDEHGAVALDHAPRHVRGVLEVREQRALLQAEPVDLVAPHGQPRFEAKLRERRRGVRELGAVFGEERGERDDVAALEAHLLAHAREHHRAAERRGQGRDEQAVIAAREHAADGARGVAPEAVGEQPLLREEPRGRRPGERDATDEIGHGLRGAPSLVLRR